MTFYYNMKDYPSYVEETKRNMCCKEFWIVDNSQNNSKELQEVLDIFYNDYENCYVAEVSYSQNTSRLVVRCNLCNATLSSFDPFISHNNGKSHKKLVNQAFCKKEYSTPIVRYKTQELENPFEKGTLEYDLFKTKHYVIGFQFMYREIFSRGERFTCQLCRFRNMKQKQAFLHITSEKHSMNYLNVKFDVNSKKLYQSEYQQYIEDVTMKEGKLYCKLFTIDCTDEEEDRSRSVSSKDESDSRGSTSRSPSRESEVTPDPKMDKVEDFMVITSKHLSHIKKNNGDNITKELKSDIEAVDLLIGTSQVLAQKIYIYSLEEGNRGFEPDAKALMNKTELLKPVLDEKPKDKEILNVELV